MDERYTYLPPNCVIKPSGPQCIVVNQVIGEQTIQKVIEVHLVVPQSKPAIEQVVDVMVKHLCITEVEVIPCKVIVRGHFELKALYVACLPSQPVHAIEARHVRFTAAADIPGAHHGLDADAHAVVEYVDYSTRRHPFYRLRSPGKNPKWKKHHHYPQEPDYEEDDCADDDKPDCKPKHKPHCKPKHKHCHPAHCCREIDVTVIIAIRVKVTTDREIILYANAAQLPYKPKG